MGFLDLLSKKKKEGTGSNVPPPAPGVNQGKQGDNNSSAAGAVPPPPGTGKDKGGEKENIVPKPGHPGSDKDNLPGGNNENHGNQNTPPKPAPAFKEDFPKLDLPKFPGNSSNLDVPNFGSKGGSSQSGNQQQEGSQAQENVKPSSMPQPQQSGETKDSRVNDMQPDSNLNSNTNEERPQMPKAPSGFGSGGQIQQQKNSPGSTLGAPNNMPPPAPQSQNNIQQQNSAQQSNTDQQASQPVQRDKDNQDFNRWHPSKFASEEEKNLNKMKQDLHKPAREVGTDDLRIGNVEDDLKKKRHVTGPLYVEINDYKRVLSSVDEIKRDVNESQDFVLKLDEFNDNKHAEFEKWKKCFEYIHNKLGFVDKTLFKESDK